MTKKFLSISYGTFTLSETEVENQFYFYRNDGDVLTDIEDEPMDLYHLYVIQKMMNCEITESVVSNISYEISDDGKCIRLTVHNIENTVSKKPNLFKRLFNKIFR